jgi:hypothetical protein
MSNVPLPEPDQLEIVDMRHPGVITVKGYSADSMHAHAAAVSAADNAALREKVAAAEQASRWESDMCQQALERIKVLEDAIALAYGHLWCINAEHNVEAPVYTAEAAASTARKILRDKTDVEQRGDGITAAREALKGAGHE